MQRFLEKGYDQLRRQPEKKAAVSALMTDFGGQHDHLAIVKKWSDLKRRHMDQVRRLRDRYHPGKLLLTVMFFFFQKCILCVNSKERGAGLQELGGLPQRQSAIFLHAPGGNGGCEGVLPTPPRIAHPPGVGLRPPNSIHM